MKLGHYYVELIRMGSLLLLRILFDGVGQVRPRRHDRVRIETERINALLRQPLRKVGEIRRALPADPHVLAARLGRRDDVRQGLLHRGVPLVEVLRDEARVTVEPKCQLGEVVRSDREPVEVVEELVSEEHVRRQLGHHLHLQAVLPSLEAVLLEQFVHLPRHVQGADEGNHELHVRQAHLLAHLLHGQELQLEALSERLVRVTPGPSEANHRVFLVGLEEGSPEQRLVLVRLEV
mmetsp:Transcript_19289/g.36300  ORF Transcript_19289/g.36300 Transcript_19289/m.36300 type:complete len:235 (+) Transcript_19289:482-1186(+)